MSHVTPINGDPAARVPIVLRRARNATIIFSFKDIEGNQIMIGEGDYDNQFSLQIRRDNRTTSNLLELRFTEGLSIVDGKIHAAFTESNSDIDHYKCFFELINEDSGQTWLAADIFFNTGEPIDGTTTEEETTINIGDQVVSCTITIPGENASPVISFTTELTFNTDKDLATVSGGTRTFALAASGHRNGIAIVARINEPDAVNFPVDFEQISGSDDIDTSAMNIIIFRYFENYDGAGNDKVLYIIKNQQAL